MPAAALPAACSLRRSRRRRNGIMQRREAIAILDPQRVCGAMAVRQQRAHHVHAAADRCQVHGGGLKAVCDPWVSAMRQQRRAHPARGPRLLPAARVECSACRCRCQQVQRSAALSVLAVGIGPASSTASSVALHMLRTAKCRGLRPSLLRLDTRAPCCSSSAATSAALPAGW